MHAKPQWGEHVEDVVHTPQNGRPGPEGPDASSRDGRTEDGRGRSRNAPGEIGPLWVLSSPTQHPYQQDEDGEPEYLRPDRGRRHEEVEPAGEREGDHEHVPVAGGELRENAVEEPILPRRHAPAARLGLLAPRDDGEGAEHAGEEKRERRPARDAARARQSRHDAAEERHVHDGVAGDVEPVAEARLGEAEPRQLAVLSEGENPANVRVRALNEAAPAAASMK